MKGEPSKSEAANCCKNTASPVCRYCAIRVATRHKLPTVSLGVSSSRMRSLSAYPFAVGLAPRLNEKGPLPRDGQLGRLLVVFRLALGLLLLERLLLHVSPAFDPLLEV